MLKSIRGAVTVDRVLFFGMVSYLFAAHLIGRQPEGAHYDASPVQRAIWVQGDLDHCNSCNCLERVTNYIAYGDFELSKNAKRRPASAHAYGGYQARYGGYYQYGGFHSGYGGRRPWYSARNIYGGYSGYTPYSGFHHYFRRAYGGYGGYYPWISYGGYGGWSLGSSYGGYRGGWWRGSSYGGYGGFFRHWRRYGGYSGYYSGYFESQPTALSFVEVRESAHHVLRMLRKLKEGCDNHIHSIIEQIEKQFFDELGV